MLFENFAKITGKCLWQSLFLNKVAGIFWQYFPVNFEKFSRTHLFYKTSPGCYFWKLSETTKVYSLKWTCGWVCFFHRKIDVSRYQILDLVYKVSIYDIFRVINPFLINIPILYPLKTQENSYFSGVFRG